MNIPFNKKYVFITGISLALISFVIGWFLIFTSTHMIRQPNVRTFETILPNPPDGALPVQDQIEIEDSTLANPLPVSRENLQRGQVYYQYYCIFCHGEKGRGNGPVGHSYMPKPADLTSDSLQAWPDVRWYRSMLSGTGHAPVLEKVVPPEHRWFVVLYAKSLKKR
ncbi:MAG: cytochrome c [Calditrichia bacterium]